MGFRTFRSGHQSRRQKLDAIIGRVRATLGEGDGQVRGRRAARLEVRRVQGERAFELIAVRQNRGPGQRVVKLGGRAVPADGHVGAVECQGPHPGLGVKSNEAAEGKRTASYPRHGRPIAMLFVAAPAIPDIRVGAEAIVRLVAVNQQAVNLRVCPRHTGEHPVKLSVILQEDQDRIAGINLGLEVGKGETLPAGHLGLKETNCEKTSAS